MTDELKQILCDLIERHGRELVREPKRLEGMLNDACAGQHRGARRVLVDAVQERVVEELLALGPNEPAAVVVGRAQQRLIDNLAIAPDSARWAVQAWAVALQVPNSMESEPTFGQAIIEDAELESDAEIFVAPLPQRGHHASNQLGATQYPRAVSSNAHRLHFLAVGIDLGTTSSCIAYLDGNGEPITIPNQEGELNTPSVVMFDGRDVIVGSEALRNVAIKPLHVVQNAKRYIGSNKTWTIEGKTYTPVNIGAFVLRKLLDSAKEQIGDFKEAVITVPAQFSDWQRQVTIEAGLQAGLKQIDIINEPVAQTLCYVLGSDGPKWFTELTDEQRILVYDLSRLTFDVSLVRYHKDGVNVLASTGDLKLGSVDWNEALQIAICDRFAQEFADDPRSDPESMQLLAMAVESAIVKLNDCQRVALTCSHGTHRKTYKIEIPGFEKLTKPLLNRTIAIVRELQKAYGVGLKHSDMVLTTGVGAHMPAIKRALNELGLRTANTTLTDQSIAHGAVYYAGMLATNAEFRNSVRHPVVR